MERKTKIQWTPGEMQLLNAIGLEFDPADELTEDQLSEIYMLAPDYTSYAEDGSPQGEGIAAEEIITTVGRVLVSWGVI